MVMFYGECCHGDVFMENATMVMFYGECCHSDVFMENAAIVMFLWRMLPW